MDVAMENAVHRIALDIVRNRRDPAHPEYMTSECPMLNWLSVSYPSTVHGYSTTLMATMFRFDFIAKHFSYYEMMRLISYVHVGQPPYRSAHDGMHQHGHLHVQVTASLSRPLQIHDCE
jgi:hypothetical protein